MLTPNRQTDVPSREKDIVNAVSRFTSLNTRESELLTELEQRLEVLCKPLPPVGPADGNAKCKLEEVQSAFATELNLQTNKISSRCNRLELILSRLEF